jgi:hypothetical protein
MRDGATARRRDWLNQISKAILSRYQKRCDQTTKTYLTCLPPKSRFHRSMTAAPASVTLRTASGGVAGVSGVAVGLVVVLGLISPGAVAG